jgi:hypothetical protein
VANKKNMQEAAGFASGGGALGAVIASFVGNMGLAGAFGGIAIGAAPVICVGTVVGVAAYGVKKSFE